MKNSQPAFRFQSRRSFIRNGSLFLLGAGSIAGCQRQQQPPKSVADAAPASLRFGMLTDVHFADKAPSGTRFYRQSIGKLQQTVEQFQKDQPQFIVALGDMIDAAEQVDVEKGYLEKVTSILETAPGDKHYVLGNHCVSTLTKKEFLAGVKQQESNYSFDVGEYHFVILDACFREDGQPYGRNNFTWTDSNIPTEQLDWLGTDLAAANKTTIVFAHQRLDPTDSHSVRNAAEVRSILEQSGNVHTVFQGHSHANSHQEIEGIHYCVLAAMIEGSGAENNGYCTVDLLDGNTIKLTGFHQQDDYHWPIS